MAFTLTGRIKPTGRIKTGSEILNPPVNFTNTLAFTLNNPTPALNDNYGLGVDVSGNTAIVGSYNNNTGGTNAGSAYIYNTDTGALLHTLNNPAPASGDAFGYDAAIDGNFAIIGAFPDDAGATDAGSAYIYDVTTGALLHTLNNPTPAGNDYLGYKVDISGNRAIVSAFGDNTGTTDAGSAYIYDVTTGALLRTINNPTPANNDRFGIHVAIDGNFVIISADFDNTGASNAGSAYIYNATTGALLHTLNNPSPQTDDRFGTSVSISGNHAIVGAFQDNTGATSAGSAYIYDVTTGALLHTLNNPAPVASDSFGYDVEISGNLALVSAPFDDTGATNAGSVYGYDVTTGELLHTINNPIPAVDDNFGLDMGLDNGTVVIGAYLDDTGATDSGSAYIYK